MLVEPMVLADRLGLSVVTRELTEDFFSVFEQIFFHDCDTEVFNSDTREMEIIHFPERTIVVDPKAFHMRNLGVSTIPSCMSAYIGISIERSLNWNDCTTVTQRR